MSETRRCDVVIVGSGPAGYTAAIYASRAGLDTIVLTGTEAGGQLTTTTEVENYPGFPDGIQGPELMEKFQKQAERFGAKVVPEKCTKAHFGSRPFRLEVSGGIELVTRSVIIATGASATYLDLPSLQKFRSGGGVTACATCDGFFYKEQDVLVIGGGDTAMEEALFLTRFCRKVTVVHRRDKLRASKIMQDRAFANPKITFAWDSEVIDVKGDKAVVGATLKNLKTGVVADLECTGIFMAIGHRPNTDFLAGALPLDELGYIDVQDHVSTSVPGVFAAGDVRDHRYRQAVTAAGWGCMAAMDVEKFLEANP